MIEEYTLELLTFIEKIDNIYNKYMDERFPNNKKEALMYKVNKKYTKLIRGSGVFGFIDNSNGDVLFPKSWSVPDKKNVRGNIFSEQNGMEAITQNHMGSKIHPHIKYLK